MCCVYIMCFLCVCICLVVYACVYTCVCMPLCVCVLRNYYGDGDLLVRRLMNETQFFQFSKPFAFYASCFFGSRKAFNMKLKWLKVAE